MAQAVKTNGDGGMVLARGRAVLVSGVEAQGQLLSERLMLDRGDDAFRPARGVRWSELKALRVSPSVAAVAVQEEAELEPIVVAADVQPEGTGYLSRADQPGEPWRVWALRVSATVSGNPNPIDLAVQVPLG